MAAEVEKTILDTLSRIQNNWYRVGGVAAIVLGIGYIIIIPLYAHVGAPPNGGEAWFKYLPGKTTFWWAILGLCVFTDFVYVPVAFALYLALKELNRNLMLLATALGTGLLGLLSLTGFSLAIIGNALFTTAWLFFVGNGLYRLAQE